MAEIPGLPDITGIDPLNPMGLPVVPQAAPMGIQSPIPPVVPELAGVQGLDMYQPSPEPLPWPPPDFFAGGQPPIPEDPTAPSPGEVIPESAPATQQAGPAGLAALEQARAEGVPPPPVQYKNAPPPRQSTGDPYLDMLNETSGQKAEALQAKSEAEKRRNEYVAAEGTRIAQEAQAKQTAADNEYRQVYSEAKAKRAELDAEAKAIAEQKIDPDRAMNAMSVEKKIAIAVGAIVVSQSSNSLRSGKNSVMDAVNDIVTRDMAAQEADLKNRKDVLLTRRGLASDDQSAGRDMLDVQYRSINAAYGMAENAMKSAQLRYNNPVLDADLAYQYAELEERRTTLGQNYIQAKQEQIYQRKQDANRNALGWYNAQTGRMGEENQAAARGNTVADERLAHQKEMDEGDRVIMSRHTTGKVIGRAPSKEAAENARKIIDNSARMEVLYLRGKKLFENGRADNPASSLYREQQAFDVQWVNAGKTADGDFSAPNAADFERRGIFGGLTSMNPVDALEETYRNARAQGAAALRPYVDDDNLTAEGFLTPPPKDEADQNRNPANVVKTLYWDADKKEVNRDGRGTPLSEEETAAVEANPGTFDIVDSNKRGVFYDAKTKTYNVDGVGERLPPEAEAQVRAQPNKFPIVRSGVKARGY